jgi:HSP20 family protein
MPAGVHRSVARAGREHGHPEDNARSEHMIIANYQPWQLLDRFRRELDQAYPTSGQASNWAPSVDVREEENRYTLHADLPGVDAKDIQITADDGVLTIRGDRHSEQREGKSGYEYLERSAGTFQRRFSLPDNALADQIKARHTNGVLEVVIPKQGTPEPRRINVEVN